MVVRDFPARFVSVEDAGRLVLDVDLGFNVRLTVRVRLHGVKLPSRRSDNTTEREDAQRAMDLIVTHIANRPLRIRARPPLPEEDEKLFHAEVVFPDGGQEKDLASALLAAALAERRR